MSNKSNTTLLEQLTLQPNVMAMLSTSIQEVDPIIEIQVIYNVDRSTAIEVYEIIGDNYTNEDLMAKMFCIATPSYITKMKGDSSC